MEQESPSSRHFKVEYPTPIFPARNTYWRWTGHGEIVFEGRLVRLTGKRRRSFWFPGDQSIAISLDQFRDVEQAGAVVTCVVELEGRGAEHLTLRFASSSEAEQVTAILPVTQSEAYQQNQVFARELARNGTRAVVTPVLVATCAVMFVILVAEGVSLWSPRGPEMIQWGTNYGPLTLNGELWRLLTAMFLHFGLLHLALNMWVLWSTGPQIERLLGNVRFAVLFLCSGLCGGIASLLWNPLVNSAGASGAIFGLIGAWLALTLNPATRIPRTVATAQRNSSIAFVAYNTVFGLMHQGIDNAAHLGGLVAGFGIGWFLARPLGAPQPAAPDATLLRTASGAFALMGALTWWLLHPGPEAIDRREFALTLNRFAEWEDQAVKLQQALYKDVQDKRISDEEWAEQMRHRVEPLWESANAEVLRLKPGEDATRGEAAQNLQNYVRLRIQWVELSADGVQRHDDSTLRQALDVDNQVGVALDQVHAAFQKLKL